MLSAGHGSALLYSLLHLTGYDLSLDDLKQFRQWGSKTPGHPGARPHAGRRGHDRAARPGLRQRRRHGDRRSASGGALQPRRPRVVDHHTWAIVSDGDLMEGVASEAASLAGHLQARQADLPLRRQPRHALGRHRHDVHRGSRAALRGLRLADDHASTTATTSTAIDAAHRRGARRSDATVADPRAHAHRLRLARAGQLQGARLAARRRGRRRRPRRSSAGRSSRRSSCPSAALAHFREALARGAKRRGRLERAHARRTHAPFPTSPRELAARLRGELPDGWDADIPAFPADAKGMATRVAGGKVMNAIAPKLPALVGGSADLDPSTHTALKELGDFNPPMPPGEDTAGLGRRRLELRRPQPPLRRARARDGRDRQRPGGARRLHPVRLDVPDLLRLHAPADPARGADGPARRSTSSRTTASRSARTGRRTSRSSSSRTCARFRT